MTQPVSVIRTPSVWPFIGTPWSSSTSSGGTSGIVVVLDVVVEVVLDVVVVAGEAVVVVVDGDTVSVVGIVTSVGAKSAEDDPHAACKKAAEHHDTGDGSHQGKAGIRPRFGRGPWTTTGRTTAAAQALLPDRSERGDDLRHQFAGLGRVLADPDAGILQRFHLGCGGALPA